MDIYGESGYIRSMVVGWNHKSTLLLEIVSLLELGNIGRTRAVLLSLFFLSSSFPKMVDRRMASPMCFA